MNFSNNSTSSLSNGVYGLNLPPWPSKPCTVVVRHISLTSCNATNLRDLCAHPVLISFRSPVTTYLLDLVLFRSQNLKFTACQHPRISVTSYFQTSSRDILLSVSLPHFSCLPCLEYLCLRALILLRLWRHINHVLIYLLTYLLICSPEFRQKVRDPESRFGHWRQQITGQWVSLFSNTDERRESSLRW